MKLNGIFSLKSLVKATLILSLSVLNVSADTYYSIVGKISTINDKSIQLVDNAYPFMPTLKVINREGKPGKLSILKKGLFVEITILNLDGKRRVDTIQVIDSPIKK